MGPAIMAAIAAGGIKGAASLFSARRSSTRAKRSIRDAYERGEANLTTRQGDIRNSVNENLAARGLLNAGEGTVANQGTRREDSFGRRSEKGAVGLSGTIASAVSGDLSKEFYKEHEELWRQRQDAIRGVKDSTRAAYIGAIAGAVGTGAQAYSAFGGGEAPGLTPEQSATAGAPAPLVSPVTHAPVPASGIPGAYGVDPVDPLSAITSPNFSLQVAPRTSR